MLEVGGAHALTLAVSASTTAQDAHACAQLCRALGNLCYGWGPEVDDAKETIASSEGPRLVVEALQTFGERPDVVRWGAHACRNLSVRSEVMQKALVKGGALVALVRGLVRHGPSHPKLAVFCFAALAFVASGHSPQKLPVSAMSSYVALMEASREDREVQQYGSLAISYATTGENGEENCWALAAAGGLRAIANALEGHQDSPGVARWAVTALGNILEALLVHDHDTEGSFETACPDPEWDSDLYTRLCSLVEAASQTHARNKKVTKAVMRCRRGLVLDPDMPAPGSGCAVA